MSLYDVIRNRESGLQVKALHSDWRCPSSNPLGAPPDYGTQPFYEAHSDLLAKKSKTQ